MLVVGVGFPLLLGKGTRLFGGKAKATGQTSNVRTARLDLRLDHDSGAMEGEVLAGVFAGRKLAELGLDDLRAVLLECRDSDPQSQSLMEAYLDHRHPGWRDADGGPSAQDAGTGSAPGKAGAMTHAEARALLGVGPQATSDEIKLNAI